MFMNKLFLIASISLVCANSYTAPCEPLSPKQAAKKVAHFMKNDLDCFVSKVYYQVQPAAKDLIRATIQDSQMSVWQLQDLRAMLIDCYAFAHESISMSAQLAKQNKSIALAIIKELPSLIDTMSNDACSCDCDSDCDQCESDCDEDEFGGDDIIFSSSNISRFVKLLHVPNVKNNEQLQLLLALLYFNCLQEYKTAQEKHELLNAKWQGVFDHLTEHFNDQIYNQTESSQKMAFNVLAYAAIYSGIVLKEMPIKAVKELYFDLLPLLEDDITRQEFVNELHAQLILYVEENFETVISNNSTYLLKLFTDTEQMFVSCIDEQIAHLSA